MTKKKDNITPEKKPFDLTKAKVATKINGATGRTDYDFERLKEEAEEVKELEKLKRKQKTAIKKAEVEIARFDNLDDKHRKVEELAVVYRSKLEQTKTSHLLLLCNDYWRWLIAKETEFFRLIEINKPKEQLKQPEGEVCVEKEKKTKGYSQYDRKRIIDEAVRLSEKRDKWTELDLVEEIGISKSTLDRQKGFFGLNVRMIRDEAQAIIREMEK